MNYDFFYPRVLAVGILLGLASTVGGRADEIVDKNGNHIITVPPKGQAARDAELNHRVITITADERIIYRDQVIALDRLAQALRNDGVGAESLIRVKADSKCRYPFLRTVLKTLGDEQPSLKISFSVISDANSKSK